MMKSPADNDLITIISKDHVDSNPMQTMNEQRSYERHSQFHKRVVNAAHFSNYGLKKSAERTFQGITGAA